MSKELLSSVYVIQNALLVSKLSKRLDNQLSVHGISFTEFMIMRHLDGSPLKTMRRIELAEHVGISASGVTRLIAPMEKNKIVEKMANPRDARQSLVKLSKTGQQLYQDAKISFEHCADNIVSDLSKNQLEKLIELTGRIR
ncbi:MAG: MarR family transcriptional regulator [Moraxellaceae bacterium]|nr:MAG: MarR family transcriptional regulator [Moraxellaceae bacterium]